VFAFFAMAATANALSLSVLAQYFHLPIKDVAKELGICMTILKRICRRNGITRWPHRKVVSIDRRISTLEANIPNAEPCELDAFRQEIHRLREQRLNLARRPAAIAGKKISKNSKRQKMPSKKQLEADDDLSTSSGMDEYVDVSKQQQLQQQQQQHQQQQQQQRQPTPTAALQQLALDQLQQHSGYPAHSMMYYQYQMQPLRAATATAPAATFSSLVLPPLNVDAAKPSSTQLPRLFEVVQQANNSPWNRPYAQAHDGLLQQHPSVHHLPLRYHSNPSLADEQEMANKYHHLLQQQQQQQRLQQQQQQQRKVPQQPAEPPASRPDALHGLFTLADLASTPDR